MSVQYDSTPRAVEDGSNIATTLGAASLGGTANTLVEIVTLTASVTGSVYCNLQGYTGS